MKNKTMKLKYLIGIFALVLLLPFVKADKLVLDGIMYDPAIISAGDEVDIIVQFHNERVGEPVFDYEQDPEYKLRVILEPDDTLTEDYVLIADEEGDSLIGHVYANQYFNVKYRVKFMNDAPAGNYEFRLKGVYEYQGEETGKRQFIRFQVPVKKEGIILGTSNMVTTPSEIRPGDDYIRMDTYIENVGEKDAKALSIDLDMPEGITSSYSNDNHLWIGRLNAGESKMATFFLDLDDELNPGRYEIGYDISYMDLDNNLYEDEMVSRLLVKDRPYLMIESYEGEGLAGKSGELTLNIKNEGGTSAESIDVRLIKQSSQPFNFDVRSKYLGELEPGESGKVIFDIDTRPEADVKNHSFKVVIRAKGDTDEGDDRIYLFDREAQYEISGEAPNTFKTVGLALLGLIMIFLIFKSLTRKTSVGGRR